MAYDVKTAAEYPLVTGKITDMMAHTVPERKDDRMKLEELLKDSPEVLKAVNDALEKVNAGQEDKLKHVRFADLSEGGYVSKGKYDSLEADLTGKSSELEKANGLIAELKKSAGKDEETQQKISTYEQEITALKAENAKLKTENALKFALAEAGAVDVDYLMFKAKEKGEIKLDDAGKVKGVDDLIKGLKTQLPTMFKGGDGAGGAGGAGGSGRRVFENNLPDGDQGDTVTKEKFAQMGYEERLALKKSNPERFKQLSKN